MMAKTMRSIGSLVVLLAGSCLLGTVVRSASGGPSVFCHVVDGAFTTCPAGGSEWSDVIPDSFGATGAIVYSGQDAAHTQLFVSFDHVSGVCPALGSDDCAAIEFDATTGGQNAHYLLRVGACSEGGLDVFVNDVKLAEGAERGIVAASGCGPSPSNASAHPIYEVSLPLNSVYPTSVGEAWRTRFPAPPVQVGADSDGDGTNDDLDACRFSPDPRQDDDDADGVGDACDPCPASDVDGDGVPDDDDNCPTVANGGQRDRDLDDVGDPCDDCPGDENDECNPRDSDRDGVSNGEDDCPTVADPLQIDTDGDGAGDVCDPCPDDDTNVCVLPAECRECVDSDIDSDGLPDDADNCPTIANADQSDIDADAFGDACDSCPTDELDGCDFPRDQDGDEIEDSDDVCPTVSDPDQDDLDGDGIGDACDPCASDDLNECGCPATGLIDADLVEAQSSLLTVGTDGSTTSVPRALCGSPAACASANPKVVQRFVARQLLALRKCAQKGSSQCDLTKAAQAGALPVACRTFNRCMIDDTIELLFGSQSPSSQPLSNSCARGVANHGATFVIKQLVNHLNGKDDKTPAAELKARGKVAKACAAGIPAGTLGGACAGITDHAIALDCLFAQLERMMPVE